MTTPVSVEVIEPSMGDRVRRSSDAYLLILSTVALVLALLVGLLAETTTGALEQDLTEATGGLPRLLLQLLAWLAGSGSLLVPLVVAVDLLTRSRGWQFVHASLASGVAAGIAMVLKAALQDERFARVLSSLTHPVASGRTNPLDVLVVALVAFVIVANVSGRRWVSALGPVVLGSVALTAFLAGATTALAMLCSFLLGGIVGHGVRFALGTASTRAPGTSVARELVLAGVPLRTLELLDDYDEGARHYAGRTAANEDVDVHVFDRDTFGLASGRRLINRLRLRGATARGPALTLRAALEHQALQALALQWAGVPAPVALAVCDVEGVSAAIATTRVEGRTLREIGTDLTDDQARAVMRMLVAMQDHRLSFRGLDRDSIVLLPDGTAGVNQFGDGDIGGDDLSRRADAAQVLVMLGLALGAERAVQIAVECEGARRVSRTLPLLQPLALGRTLRTEAKADKGLLDALREQVQQLDASKDEPATIELRRFTVKGMLTLLGGAVAAYIVLPQLARVDFGSVVEQAEWGWAVASLVAAGLTFTGATLVLMGSVPSRLSFLRTYMTQLAVAFSALIAPAAIGNIALNTRYLQRSGVPAAAAGASVGLAQVFQFGSYATLLGASMVIAGTGPQSSFQPPAKVVAALPIVLVVVLSLFAVPRVRRFFLDRVVPQVRTVVPQVLSVFQRPRKLAQLVGGALVLDVSFVAALYFAVRAFGAEPPLAAVGVVYFAGAIIGSAVPTPGGLGGIEAVMWGGLQAIGVESASAFSAVMLYRLMTYWVPIPFGWMALQRLTKSNAI